MKDCKESLEAKINDLRRSAWTIGLYRGACELEDVNELSEAL